jgi:hypothetical protein
MSDEELARTSANILGASSAAALALAELDRLRAEGNPAEIINDSRRRRWVVVGRKPTDLAGEGARREQ